MADFINYVKKIETLEKTIQASNKFTLQEMRVCFVFTPVKV